MSVNRTVNTQLRTECKGLVLTFMPHDNNSNLRKAITLLFVTVWLIITLGLAFQDFAVVQPPFYGVFTAIVFLIVGKQWDIEVQRLMNLGSGDE